MASCTSPRVSASTLPISRVMSRAYCSLRCWRRMAALTRISARLGAGTRRQEAKAFFAAATARSTSSGPEAGKVPTMSSWSAGLTFCRVLPLFAGSHWPPIRLLYAVTLMPDSSNFSGLRVCRSVWLLKNDAQRNATGRANEMVSGPCLDGGKHVPQQAPGGGFNEIESQDGKRDQDQGNVEHADNQVLMQGGHHIEPFLQGRPQQIHRIADLAAEYQYPRGEELAQKSALGDQAIQQKAKTWDHETFPIVQGGGEDQRAEQDAEPRSPRDGSPGDAETSRLGSGNGFCGRGDAGLQFSLPAGHKEEVAENHSGDEFGQVDHGRGDVGPHANSFRDQGVARRVENNADQSDGEAEQLEGAEPEFLSEPLQQGKQDVEEGLDRKCPANEIPL